MNGEIPLLSGSAANISTRVTMNLSLLRFASLAIALVFALLLITACGAPIQVPSSDSTDPEIALTYGRLESSVVTLNEGDANRTYTLQAPTNQVVSFIATATDEDGGVHRASIHTSIGFRCENRDTTQTNARGHGGESEVNNAQPGEDAETVLATSLKLDFSDVHTECQPGSSFLGAQYEIFASAENFHGGTAETPRVTINVSPQ